MELVWGVIFVAGFLAGVKCHRWLHEDELAGKQTNVRVIRKIPMEGYGQHSFTIIEKNNQTYRTENN